jgi:hypothetical protein
MGKIKLRPEPGRPRPRPHIEVIRPPQHTIPTSPSLFPLSTPAIPNDPISRLPLEIRCMIYSHLVSDPQPALWTLALHKTAPPTPLPWAQNTPFVDPSFSVQPPERSPGYDFVLGIYPVLVASRYLYAADSHRIPRLLTIPLPFPRSPTYPFTHADHVRAAVQDGSLEQMNIKELVFHTPLRATLLAPLVYNGRTHSPLQLAWDLPGWTVLPLDLERIYVGLCYCANGKPSMPDAAFEGWITFWADQIAMHVCQISHSVRSVGKIVMYVCGLMGRGEPASSCKVFHEYVMAELNVGEREREEEVRERMNVWRTRRVNQLKGALVGPSARLTRCQVTKREDDDGNNGRVRRFRLAGEWLDRPVDVDFYDSYSEHRVACVRTDLKET